jgi:hypothetical protein
VDDRDARDGRAVEGRQQAAASSRPMVRSTSRWAWSDSLRIGSIIGG